MRKRLNGEVDPSQHRLRPTDRITPWQYRLPPAGCCQSRNNPCFANNLCWTQPSPGAQPMISFQAFVVQSESNGPETFCCNPAPIENWVSGFYGWFKPNDNGTNWWALDRKRLPQRPVSLRWKLKLPDFTSQAIAMNGRFLNSRNLVCFI